MARSKNVALEMATRLLKRRYDACSFSVATEVAMEMWFVLLVFASGGDEVAMEMALRMS